jgi:mRNA interferase MazF
MVINYIPDKGDVIWINFDPQAGREQGRLRPGLVLSPKNYNEIVGLLIGCPITSKIKEFPFEVRIPEGLEVKGIILADHIKSMDWKVRGSSFICKIPEEILEEVLLKIENIIF